MRMSEWTQWMNQLKIELGWKYRRASEVGDTGTDQEIERDQEERGS